MRPWAEDRAASGALRLAAASAARTGPDDLVEIFSDTMLSDLAKIRDEWSMHCVYRAASIAEPSPWLAPMARPPRLF